jgi:hypothetical protein
MDARSIAGWLAAPPESIRLLCSSHEELTRHFRERGPSLGSIARATCRKPADPSGAPLGLLTLLATSLRLVSDGAGRARIEERADRAGAGRR